MVMEKEQQHPVVAIMYFIIMVTVFTLAQL